MRLPEAAAVATVAPAPPGDVPMTPPPSFEGAHVAAATVPVALRDPQFAGVVPSGGTWSVVIGIDRYPGGSHDLAGAVNDASDLNAALAADGVPGDHRLLIRDEQATAGVLRASADWLVAHAASDATATFFYAGHVRQLSDGSVAMVGADGGLFTNGELADRLQGLRAHFTWVAIAGCYGGAFASVLGPGRILTAAAPAGQLAFENENFHRSYLGEYMVHQGMLEGRAPGTAIQAAFAYAQAALRRDYPDRVPLEYDDAGQPVDLHMGAEAPSTQAGSPSSSGIAPPPPSAPPGPGASSPPGGSAHPGGGSSGGGTSGGGSSGGGSSGGNSGPGGSNPSPDTCTRLSFGAVRCSQP